MASKMCIGKIFCNINLKIKRLTFLVLIAIILIILAQGIFVTAQSPTKEKAVIEQEIRQSSKWVRVLPVGRQNSSLIHDMVPHPKEENTLYLLIHSFYPGYENSCSIFKTTNGSMSWELLSLMPSGTCSEDRYDNLYGGRLFFDNKSPDVLYYAGVGGLQKSVDGGRTWADIGAGMIKSDIYTVIKFAQDSENPSILYVRTGNTLFKSLNGGKTWGKVSEPFIKDQNNGLWTPGQPSQVISNGIYYASLNLSNIKIGTGVLHCSEGYHDFADFSFSVIARNPVSPNILYGKCTRAMAGIYPQTYLLKSSDNGLNWDKINLPISPTFKFYSINDYIMTFGLNNGQYVGYIIISGVLLNDPYPAQHNSYVVYKTLDDGGTWNLIMEGLPLYGLRDVEAVLNTHRALLVSSHKGELYINTNEGIYKSGDGGEHWFYPGNLGFPIGSPLQLVKQNDSNMLYAIIPFEQLSGWGNSGDRKGYRLYKSGDGGISWTSYQLDSVNALTLLALSDGKVEFSESGKAIVNYWGIDTGKIYKDLGSKNIAISPSNPQIIYSNSGATIIKSEDGGGSWTEVKGPFSGGISFLLVDKTLPQSVLVVSGDKIYSSIDGGTNWADISKSLHKTIDNSWLPMINVIKDTLRLFHERYKNVSLIPGDNDFDKFNSKIKTINTISMDSSGDILVTTVLGGAYRSHDKGKTWKPLFVFSGGIEGGVARAVKNYKQKWWTKYEIDKKLNKSKKPNIESLRYLNPFEGIRTNWNEIGLFGVNDVFLSSKHPEIIFIATQWGVFISIDEGHKWKSITVGLNSFNARHIIADSDLKLIFVETDDGIYRLSDYEMTWAKPDKKEPSEKEMVLIKGGCFEMGDTFGDGAASEKPVHDVCVNDFYMSKYEVTQRQWFEVMGTNQFNLKCCTYWPAYNVSWNDAQNFIGRLNQKTGKNYRLPTEAEWEYAARSGGQKEKWAGTSNEGELVEYAWLNNLNDTYYPVGQKKPNGLGLYDMSGNISEWVQDWYDERYFRDSPKINPTGPSSGKYRVVRGGDRLNGPLLARASSRSAALPDNHYACCGFRLVGTK